MGAGWYRSRRWLHKSWRWSLLKLWQSSFKPALFFKNQGQYQLTDKWRVWIQNNWISWEIYEFLKFVEAVWYNSVCYKQEFIFAFYDKKLRQAWLDCLINEIMKTFFICLFNLNCDKKYTFAPFPNILGNGRIMSLASLEFPLPIITKLCTNTKNT